jgi:hypothetical protein
MPVESTAGHQQRAVRCISTAIELQHFRHETRILKKKKAEHFEARTRDTKRRRERERQTLQFLHENSENILRLLQTAHTASHSRGAGRLPTRVKRSEREADVIKFRG